MMQRWIRGQQAMCRLYRGQRLSHSATSVTAWAFTCSRKRPPPVVESWAASPGSILCNVAAPASSLGLSLPLVKRSPSASPLYCRRLRLKLGKSATRNDGTLPSQLFLPPIQDKPCRRCNPRCRVRKSREQQRPSSISRCRRSGGGSSNRWHTMLKYKAAILCSRTTCMNRKCS